jgi:MFS family permease
MTIARGLTGIGVGGEYPSSSVSAVEAANEKFMKKRGMTFILVTVRRVFISAVLSKS